MQLRKIIKQPLVQFLIIGLLLFFIDWFLNEHNAQMQAKKIIISQGLEHKLKARFRKIWLRNPTDAEINGYTEEFIRSYIMTEEAKSIHS